MRKVLYLVLTLVLTVSLKAQQSAGNGSQGMQYIAQLIRQYVLLFSLDEQQALQFETLYKAYNKQLHDIHNRYRHERPAEGITPTDEQTEQRILDNFAQGRAILDIREQYYHEFRKFLTPTQINRIFEDEKTRRAEMMRKAKY